MIKNGLFHLKSSFLFSRYSNFPFNFLVKNKNFHVENQLDWKDKVNSKICDVTTWEASSCNEIHTVKFCQLIEYNMKNIFLEKSYTKCVGETIPELFLKYQNWDYPWISIRKYYTVFFYSTPSCGLSKDIETKLQAICFYFK